jgi:hypothetical protein
VIRGFLQPEHLTRSQMFLGSLPKRVGTKYGFRYDFLTNLVGTSKIDSAMQITEIDEAETNETQAAYVTEPPLTEEVFAKYSQMVGSGNVFKHKNGLLIAGRHDLDPEYLNATAEHLTQMENAIQKAHDRAENARQQLLERVSKQSGLPIRKKPPVANPGGSAGDAEQK